jgi:hypothetical protein
LEIRTALERKIPVLPVLIDGAKMPKPASLPSDVRDFAYINALRFDSEDFKDQLRRLTKALEELVCQFGKEV